MPSFSPFDFQMMQRAIDLATKGLYSTKPNPAVGCVIVQGQTIIGEGWHHQAGQPHAERVALSNAMLSGETLAGATVYVTLEPCSHTGRTPPCANALVDAKVARVVVAMQDPNPQVSGLGLARLQDAGIQVEVGLLAAATGLLNQGFIHSMEKKTPFVRIKMASSLDGRTAMESGESHWITGEAARKQVHQMRARHGALITGIGTVLADNPSMNVRLSDAELAELNLTQESCHPLRVVLDAHLSLPVDAKMLSVAGRTIVISSKQTIDESSELVDAFLARGVGIVAVSADGDKLDIESVLRYLQDEEQVHDVMVEAGAGVAGSFIQSGFVNEIHAYLAPILMGDHAKPMFSLPGLDSMSDKIQLEFKLIEQVGDDLHLVLKPKGS